ncbi:MAG: hypothetical protein M3N43_06880, partial [Actinomycetota bacterium]|nr:hypothetical protein [Actinomycetota bacterium]
MTGSITRSRSGEMHVPGPTELNQADLDRAAKTLARLCVRNGGNPAELALTLGAIGYLPPEAAERAAELLATPVHRTATENPPAATTAPETVPLCRCPGPEKHELRMAANGK